MDPSDPEDPSYHGFEPSDSAVRAARARGQLVLLVATGAPPWAEADDRPTTAPAGVWKPNPEAFESFATALALRYSGEFATDAGAVPRVDYYQAWEEPNLPDRLQPQWVQGEHGPKAYAPQHYRELLNAFSAGVKSVDPLAEVVAGSTGSIGDDPFGPRMRPLRFMRELLCLSHRTELRPDPCAESASFDVLAHHPINFQYPPSRSASDADDVLVTDFEQVVRTLRAAERLRTIEPGRHPVWATEVGWETDPPDEDHGVSFSRQARYLQDSFYALEQQGAKAILWSQIVDEELGKGMVSGQQSGLFTASGERKPSFEAFRFPFAAERTNKRFVRVWTIPPISGTLSIEASTGQSWRLVGSHQGNVSKPLAFMLELSGQVRLRAVSPEGESSRSDVVPP
ncbi:MAG: hypothetical protein ACR2OC_09835 [Solirubrobacterales bacterium]